MHTLKTSPYPEPELILKTERQDKKAVCYCCGSCGRWRNLKFCSEEKQELFHSIKFFTTYCQTRGSDEFDAGLLKFCEAFKNVESNKQRTKSCIKVAYYSFSETW